MTVRRKEKRPWRRWFWADWRADPCLRMCGYAARGLWAEMLGLMDEADPVGHLLVAGVPPNDEQLANLTGGPPEQVRGLLAELETAKVFSRTNKGVIYSRRVVRDEKRARIARKNGVLGGNPTLGKQIANKPRDKGMTTERVKTQSPEARGQTSPNGDVGIIRPDKPPDQVDVMVGLWNAMAERTGLPTVQRLGKDRRSQAPARLVELGGIAGWEGALAKVEASDFCCGRGGGKWRASFDFLMKPDKLTRLMEGAYDRPNGGGDGQHGVGGAPKKRGPGGIAHEDERRGALFRAFTERTKRDGQDR